MITLEVYDGEYASNIDEVIISVQPITPSNPSLLSREWKFGHYGTYIGKSGLSIADIDNNGTLEIVTTASQSGFGGNRMWYVIGEDGNGGYHQIWSSNPYVSPITRMLVVDTDANGISEIYIGFEDGTVHIYDGLSFGKLGNLKAGSKIAAMAVKDADGDGIADIVTSDGIKLYSFSTIDYTLQWQLTNYVGNDIAIGNVDDDISPEIVTTSHIGHGYVIDGATQTLHWDYVDGFGSRVRLGNLDTDRREEIVGAKDWYEINIFNAEIKSPDWGYSIDHDLGGLLITDENDDGIDEIIFGDLQAGIIHCLDAQTRLEKWQTPYSLTYTSNMLSYIGLDDLDNDGVKELVWGSGGNSTAADNLNIIDSVSFDLEWQSIHLEPPFSAVDVGDVDDDGQEEIVMASSYSSNTEYDAGIIHVFNAKTHILERSVHVTNRDLIGIRSLRISDVDDDGETELIITTANFSDGLIQVYNGKDLTLERESSSYSGNYFTTIEIGDVDNDGNTEIVAGQGSSINHIIVFDGATMTEEWKSISLGNSWSGVSDIILADSDNDGHIEIIAANNNNRVTVYDGVTHQLDWLGEVEARSVEVSDLDDDGVLELLIGKIDGTIDIYNGLSFDLINTFSLPYLYEIEALKVADLELDGTPELLLSNNNQLSVYDFGSFDLIWRSNDLGSNLGWYNQLIVGNIDSDSNTEVVIGSSNGLFKFE